MRRYVFHKKIFEIKISFYPLKIMVTKGNSYKSKFGTYYKDSDKVIYEYHKDCINYNINFKLIKNKISSLRKLIKPDIDSHNR